MSAAATLGIAPDFEFEGVKYPVSMRTFEHQALFTAWMGRNELDGIAVAEKYYPHLVPVMLKNWGQNMGTRTYDWGTQAAWTAYGNIPGWKYMAWLQLKEKTPSVTIDLLDRVANDERKFAELRMIMNWLDDPNRKGRSPTEIIAAS